jgi:ribosomal protein S18 acetylase RimI-like enzyme
MREAESLAIARGCTAVHVFVVTSNADARAFYTAAGYEQPYVALEKFM